MQPTITCVIPAFNVGDYLERSVESLLLCGRDDLEVVIVDDGSTDNSAQIARGLAVQFRNVKAISHPGQTNRGVSETRNLGIRNSLGRYLAFLDGDDTVFPDRFEDSIRILETDATVDAVYGNCEIVIEHESQRSDWQAGGTFGYSGPLHDKALMKSLIHGYPWHTSAITLRRELLDRTGLFDGRFQIAEDCHLWMRMAAVGCVVPGNLCRPISRYHRRACSLYSPSIERKLDFALVLCSFIEWLGKRDVSAGFMQFVCSEFSEWLDNALIECRKNNRGDLVRKLLAQVSSSRPTAAWTPRNINHLLRSLWHR